jgi:hypothetical protein
LSWRLKKLKFLLYFDKTSILVIKYQLLALNLLALALSLRNVHEINLATGADFLFAFKALKQAYSELRNYFNNAEGEQKDQPDAEVILRTFLGC